MNHAYPRPPARDALHPRHPLLIGMAIAVLSLAVAAAATSVPARRAAMVDPSTPLRQE